MTEQELAALIEINRKPIVKQLTNRFKIDASDAYQDASAACLEKLRRNNRLECTPGYLARITASRLIDSIRAAGETAPDEEDMPEQADERGTPEQIEAATGLCRQITVAVSQLTPRQQVIFRLKWQEHKSPKEIAKALKRPLRSIERETADVVALLRAAIGAQEKPVRASAASQLGPLLEFRAISARRDPLWQYWRPNWRERKLMAEGARKLAALARGESSK